MRLESSWIILPFRLKPSQVTKNVTQVDSSQVKSFCLSDSSQVKSQKIWLESTQVKASHLPFWLKPSQVTKNLTRVDSSQSKSSAFLTQAKSSHKKFDSSRLKSKQVICLSDSSQVKSQKCDSSRLKSSLVILPFLTLAKSSHNKWIVNYAMRNIRPRLKCRSVVISE